MGKNIMIVDDDFVTRYIVRDVLETGGYRVVAEASSAEEAVTKYKELQPEIVIMDIVLPHKNGLAAAMEILSFNSNAKIIVISVLDNKLLVKAAHKLGAVDFIHKPFTPVQLLEVIQNQVMN
jgi:two-component system chemotaxis response regulator CheY